MKTFIISVAIFIIVIISTAFNNIGKCISTGNKTNHTNGMIGETGYGGETTCNNCHSETYGTHLTSTLSISSIPSFINNQYVSGVTYTISIMVESSTLNSFGFDCEVLSDLNTHAISVGTLTGLPLGGTKTDIFYPSHKINVTHIVPIQGVFSGSTYSSTFTFLWTAPELGNVYINMAGMAVDGDGSASGDDIVDNSSLVLTPSNIVLSNKERNDLSVPLNSLSVFPNPSSSFVNLNYQVSSSGRIKASLYNLQGKELAVLFNDNKEMGVQTETIYYPDDIAPGVYLIKLSFNDKYMIEKLIFKQ
jgi:hypothetical protein